MTRNEHLVFCKQCTNRDFSLTEGVLCKISGKIADFESSCPDYQLDRETVIPNTPSKVLKPNQKRADIAIYMLWAVLIIDLFAIIANYFQYQLLENLNNGIHVNEAEISSNDMRVGLIAILYLIVYIVSVVTFIQWFRRAYNNLEARTIIDNNEGWAAGSWFVPIINLFRPYKIMRELFVKTEKLLSDRTGSTVKNNHISLIGLWWTLWIVVGYIGNYSLKTAFNLDTIEDLSRSTVADIITSAVEIPIGILAIMIITAFAKKDRQLLQLETESKKKLETE